MKLTLLILLLSLLSETVFSGTYYVSSYAEAEKGDGTFDNPWASLSEAVAKVPDDGSTVLVLDGTYHGHVRFNRRFSTAANFKALHPYKAVLTNDSDTEQVVTIFGGANFTFEGFEIKRPKSSKGPLLMQIQQSIEQAENITIRNNIFHDSYNDDLLKINNGCNHIVVEGNVFYNQFGFDEHIDVNGVTFVTIRDNIFFNDFEGSRRGDKHNTGAFVVIKNSAHLKENHDIVVRRNIFLNWEGSREKSFLMVGEDGKSFYEATSVLVENNLMLGNSNRRMKAAFSVMGAKDVTFRNNTIAGDLPSDAYAVRLMRWRDNPKNRNVVFYNNIWSDPTGTMGKFSTGDRSDTKEEQLKNNLFYNGGSAFQPEKSTMNVMDDKSARIGDPQLADQQDIVMPRWQPESGAFLSGSQTIREEFERLAARYGEPASGSIARYSSDPDNTPADDILGNPRGLLPDIGAFDTSAVTSIFRSSATFSATW